MSKKIGKYISVNPKILGGMPVIAGTRIPVERVYHLVRQGYSTQRLSDEYSWVDSKKIQYAIAYLMKAGLDEFEKTQKIQAASR